MHKKITKYLKKIGLILIKNFEPIRAPINWPKIIITAIEAITSPKYKNTNNEPIFVAKLRALAFAVASIRLFPLKATPLTVKKDPVPGPNMPS